MVEPVGVGHTGGVHGLGRTPGAAGRRPYELSAGDAEVYQPAAHIAHTTGQGDERHCLRAFVEFHRPDGSDRQACLVEAIAVLDSCQVAAL